MTRAASNRFDDVDDATTPGATDLCRLRGIVSPQHAAVYAKCEFRNPTGSHKDRVFHHMIATLEERGEIRPGMTLVDCSTGNGGAALARIGLQRGYRVVIIMPRGMTVERIRQIASFGATIIETPSTGFLDASEAHARDYVSRYPNSHYLDQSTNALNREAWWACGREIAEDFHARAAKVDHFVCSIGTGGTFSGISEVLKQEFPGVTAVAIEVDRSAPLFAKRMHRRFEHRPHNLMGLGPGKIAPNVREDLIDEVRTVSGDDGWTMMKRLISEEKLFAGPTAGSNVHVAAAMAEELQPTKNIVTVLFDSAWKYQSIWDGHYRDYDRADGDGDAGEGAHGA
jgi:cysteine synthase A